MSTVPTKIVLVDDDLDILEIIGYNLRAANYEVFTAENGIEAIAIAEKETPQLIILDVMMPEMDGIEACEKLRKIPGLKNTVITFLTARSEDYSQVAGFDAGADDYISKPIRPKVLLSKIKALLRRSHPDIASNSILKLGNLTIYSEEYKVIKDDEVLNLPRKEFKLLLLLTTNLNKVLTRDEILDNIWGNDVVVGNRTIDVHIRKLRAKIGEETIKTIKGVGYQFITI